MNTLAVGGFVAVGLSVLTLSVMDAAFMQKASQGLAVMGGLTGFLSMLLQRIHPAPPPVPTEEQRREMIHRLASAVRQESIRERSHQLGRYRLRIRWHARAGVRGGPRTGDVADLARIYQTLTPRRLLILGPAGSGKSMFALDLALALLGQPHEQTPPQVPVPLRVALWDPAREDLHEWIVTRLIREHDAILRPNDAVALRELVHQGRIIPILDGLDEIHPDLMVHAVREIDRALHDDHPVMVTCRTDQFTRIRERYSPGLPDALVVELKPLTISDFRDYVRRHGEEAYWRPLLRELRADPRSALATALSQPLMAWLVVRVHHQPVDAPRIDPAAVLTARTDQHHIENYLLDQLVPALFDIRTGREAQHWLPFRLAGTRKWLTFLATHLESRKRYDFAWWELRAAAPAYLPEALVGIVAGLLLGSLLLYDGRFALGAGVGPVFGAVFGFGFCNGYRIQWADERQRRRATSGGFRDEPSMAVSARRLVSAAITIGTAWLIAAAVTTAFHRTISYPAAQLHGGAILVAIFFCSSAGYAVGTIAAFLLQRMEPLYESVATIRATTPRQALRRDRRSNLVVGCMFLIVLMLISAGAESLVTQDSDQIIITAMLGGVTATGTAVMMFFAWAPYQPRHALFALAGRLPWRLMRFLDEAHDCGILRQSGALYQFRHAKLQYRLANHSTDPPASTASTPVPQ